MFQYIVADVQAKEGINVHYEHGHPIEIVNTMRGLGETPAFDRTRYPLIALFHPFPEKPAGNSFRSKINVTLLIAVLTEPLYVAERRLLCNFIPILRPLCASFLQSVLKSGYFSAYTIADLMPELEDEMYYGRDGLDEMKGNVFGDHIDAIKVKLELTVKKTNCT